MRGADNFLSASTLTRFGSPWSYSIDLQDKCLAESCWAEWYAGEPAKRRGAGNSHRGRRYGDCIERLAHLDTLFGLPPASAAQLGSLRPGPSPSQPLPMALARALQ